VEPGIEQLSDFVESLNISDGTFKQAVLEGIEAMKDSQIQRIPDTKWAYTRNSKGFRLGYDGTVVDLDDRTKKKLTRTPVYVKNLDSLFFGNNIIISKYGRVDIPEIELFIPRDDMPEEIKGTIFIAVDGKKHNFISIRDRGNGEYQWGYLFSEWAPSAGTEQTETGVKLFLSKRGRPVAELLLPELAKREGIDSKDEFFTDPRDSKKYRIVKIGNQTWLADNLNWDGAGVTYENKKTHGQKYGRLYKWEEALKVAPPGWHLPTNEEWQQLIDFAGGAENAATALKSEEWDGDDRLGFSAFLVGCRNIDGGFFDVGKNGYWWSATEKDIEFAYGYRMGNNNAEVYRTIRYKNYSFSVRLIQD